MSKVTRCSIIICDDFNNVLIAEIGKGKGNSPKIWCIVGKSIKGKETEEKCITKAIDKALKCNIFDLTPFKEYALDEESGDTLLVYSGKIREAVTCHTDINKIKWISESEVDMYDFSIDEKKALLDFFKNMK
jgi:hypothetical protein